MSTFYANVLIYVYIKVIKLKKMQLKALNKESHD